MPKQPPINPDINDIADRAKHAYATGSQLLAATQYRIAELAASGRLDPDESMSLQINLAYIWEELYYGTVDAVRDRDIDVFSEGDNTYSDGRPVKVQIQIEPFESSDLNWEHNSLVLGFGAVIQYPPGTISNIAPVNPEDDPGRGGATL